METTSERIRARRKKLGFTMQQLHESTGLSTGNISDLENGKYAPSLTALISLSQVLSCSIDWLVTGKHFDTLISEEHGRYELLDIEVDLIKTFRSLEERDQAEIIGIAKMKADRSWVGNQLASSTSKSGNASTADEMVG